MPRGKQIDCVMESPTYRQILKEVAKGYSFEQCYKTNKIIRVKLWKKYYTSQVRGANLARF